MRIWKLDHPWDPSFAHFNCVGTWIKADERDGLCPECTGAPTEVRAQPLVAEWEPGSDIVGDLVWGLGDPEVMIADSAYRKLRSRFGGFEPGPVEMVQDPKLKRPKRPTKRTKPRIWLPYKGPCVHELWVSGYVPLDGTLSTVTRTRKCSTCGDERYQADGIETIESRWNLERKALDTIHTQRIPDKGLFVREADLKGRDIFRVKEFSWWLLCTDDVKQFIENEGFTNVRFLEVGDTV